MADLAVRELLLSRRARDRYQFDDGLFAVSGRVVFADFHAARVFAQRMNERRDLLTFPEQAVSAATVNAMGLISEVLHLVVADYVAANPGIVARALAALESSLGRAEVDQLLAVFSDEFPPLPVYRRRMTVDEYLAGATGGVPHREVALEELLLLWVTNLNPAFAPYLELFDDQPLRTRTAYLTAVNATQGFFASAPGVGGGLQGLLDALRAPALASPHSLEEQLDFIRRVWGHLLGPALYRLLGSLDFLAEEHKVFFGFGPGPVEVPSFAGLDLDAESYSADLDWMPHLVLLAKNAYVWLDQLSRKHGRTIERLDQIPDQELDLLASWGVTGLWLIGLWERSRASQRIKLLMGDRDAVASAYSLYDYRVADDLGGDVAFEELKGRAGQRGIRLSTDMVPNHVGVDSRWVVEHPDWFVGLDYSPFPSYTFNGPDLSDDERVGIFIEDHYFDRTDAAVVFKRVDRLTGSVRYIYHGNDGTSMPWNDTAQLDYRNPEVREAVIRTILHVARRSPVIRFDAAMTLTRRNFHRLWFPEPGSGGDIPSRAGFGMTRSQFDEVMPNEFWREVVDRVAAEAPDTLLLAEAFWLLEGYFVRTLGMHRVYNSAFMNMLRDERNADYRQLVKSTLEFDPQILKRYVNFMSNPDERTAVDQFGKEDKYFGVATLMATMPGLPMFAHGQVEGYTEKYGMEFRRPRWNEEPDRWLVERHERQLFPLLARRRLFAEVDRFLLYDFVRPDGTVDENVFAYSNANGDERTLVLYHNRYADTRGFLRVSAPVVVKRDGERTLLTRTLAEGLGISDAPDRFLAFRDSSSGLEFLRDCQELRRWGFHAELGAYDLHVFLDFRELTDDATRRYRQLHDFLAGRGVPSLEEAEKELLLQPLLGPFRALVAAAPLARLVAARVDEAEAEVDAELLAETAVTLDALHAAVLAAAGGEGKLAAVSAQVLGTLEAVLRLPALPARLAGDQAEEAALFATEELGEEPLPWGTLLGWTFTHALGRLVDEEDAAERARSLLDEWLLAGTIAAALREQGAEAGPARRAVAALRLMLATTGWHEAGGPVEERAVRLLHGLLRNPEVQAFLGVNRHRGVLWFNHECFEEMLRWLLRLAAVEVDRDHPDELAERLAAAWEVIARLAEAERGSGYRVDLLLEMASGMGQGGSPADEP